MMLRAAWVTACAVSLGACAFPIIEFDQSPPAHRLAYVANDPTESRTATGRVVIGEPKRSRSTANRRTRASVMAPYIPEPEDERSAGSVTECHRTLSAAGVRFEVLPRSAAPGVRWPIRLRSSIRGVTFEALDKDPTHSILDCRLGLALLRWAPDLRRAGVRRVEHFSMYRPGARVAGSGAVSGHAHGMAIDAARFTLRSGAVIDVLDDWEGRRRGQSPCPVRREEGRASRVLRTVTCAAVDDQLFQVVLTPHYNKAHENHVHLEEKPDVDWTYVR